MNGDTIRAWLTAVCQLHHHHHHLRGATVSTYTLPPDVREELEEVATDALGSLVRERKLSEAAAVELVVAVLDALVMLPEPIDTAADGVARAAVTAIAAALRRDPAEMRARADQLEERGRHKRAASLRRRADRVDT